MRGLDVFGDAILKGLGDRKLWLLHSVANPLLLALFAGWLLIPEASGWELGLSVVGVVLLVGATLLLHSSTLGYLAWRDPLPRRPLVSAFARAFRNLIAFALCAVAAYLLWNSANLLDVFRITFPAYVRAAMPAFLRRNVPAIAVSNAYAAAIFVIRWILWPGLLLPLVAAVASFGFRGFIRGLPAAWIAIRSALYWLVIAAGSLVSVVLVPTLLAWHSPANNASFAADSVSIAVRSFAAFVMTVASWLAACSIASSGLRRI
jgi:hypothetical protein